MLETMCNNFHMKKKPAATYNPRSNGIIERVHQVLRDNIATFELSKMELPDANPFGSFIAAASRAMRSTLHSTLKATPGQLVLGRGMLLSLQLRASWAGARLRKQSLAGKGTAEESKSRAQHGCKAGGRALRARPGAMPEMEAPRAGPLEVKQVGANGALAAGRGAAIGRASARSASPSSG